MKITLTTNDGLVLGHWDIEEEFGDLNKPLPRNELLVSVVDEWQKYRAKEAETEAVSSVKGKQP